MRLGHVLALSIALCLGRTGHVAAGEPDGPALYKRKCALCHGRNGKPSASLAKAKVKDFTNVEWQGSRTNGQIRKVIEDGKDGTLMRGFKKHLSAKEIEALVRQVRSFVPAKKGPSGPAQE